jgi:SDR family mycofactocin-dependent oxidoreductase
MTERVAGKVALVTGVARGQGRSHAVRLAEEGADIIAVDICAPLPGVPYPAATKEDLAETVAAVEKTGRKIHAATVDTRDLTAMRTLVADGTAKFGHLDIIVANAGVCIPGEWNSITPEVFEETMSVNVTGTWNTVMSGADHLIRSGGGSIIITSSAAGLKVTPFMVPYTTSKFAVRGMAKAFAVELGRHHIRVNTVHPYGVSTPMGGDGLQAVLQPAIESNPSLGGMFTSLLPLEWAQPEDISDVVLFLASEESKYITAHELVPDAGVTEF